MAKLIEATYGDALFELAVEESRVDSLYDEAGAVIEAFNDNPSLADCSIIQKLKREKRKDLLITFSLSLFQEI